MGWAARREVGGGELPLALRTVAVNGLGGTTGSRRGIDGGGGNRPALAAKELGRCGLGALPVT